MRAAVIGASFAAVLLALSCGSDEGDEPHGSGGVGGGAGSGGTSGGGGSAGATGGGAGSGGTPDASPDQGVDAGPTDLDGDGLDDAAELALAQQYFPYFSPAPNDKCPRHGVLFRAAPHPADGSKVALWYVVLFEEDCGANSHVGDDEVFGVVVDPKTPAPAGLLAMRAISHQGTVCEKTTTCGSLPGCKPCVTATKSGAAFPVVFASVNKHGTYVEEGTCDLNVICDFGGCSLNPTPDAPPFVNAGEPGKPLTSDLTQNGFITSGNGWTKTELFGFDPWANKDFGGAGNVTDDLGDAAFVISPSGC
ncbi:MAG: hypothetical protein HYZ29_29965 [Myxococcales bacterium]|nr:hypothetical protein [Myxococcales bacterium]